jgi:hypothetical protein
VLGCNSPRSFALSAEVTVNAGSTAEPAPWLPRNPILCYRSRQFGGHLGNLGWIEIAEKETTFVSNSEAARHRAEASFKKKELQVREGAKAVADYEAVGRAVEKKTARLKALRLAKEEAGRQAAAAKKSEPPR